MLSRPTDLDVLSEGCGTSSAGSLCSRELMCPKVLRDPFSCFSKARWKLFQVAHEVARTAKRDP